MGNLGLTFAAVQASSDFRRAVSVPEALLAIHHEAQVKGQAPARAMALNRAVVVLTVAAWQAWVEKFAWLLLWEKGIGLDPDSDDWRVRRLSEANMAMRPLVEREIQKFSTPSSGAVCNLLGLLNHNPRDRWTFTVGNARLSQHEIAERLDAWVKVRHAIAHGDDHLPSVPVLDSTKGGHGSLTRPKAASCLSFFAQLVVATGEYDYRDQT